MANESCTIMDLSYSSYLCNVCEPTKYIQSIVLNFEVVLSLVMYIQGLSVIHFFGKAKRWPNAVTILLMVVGTLLTPMTHIVGLLGVIDLCINLKRIIKNDY